MNTPNQYTVGGASLASQELSQINEFDYDIDYRSR